MVFSTHVRQAADDAPSTVREYRHGSEDSGTSSTGRPGERGQSEVFGAVLLVGLVVLAATLLAVFGTATVDQRQERAAVGQAETGFEQLDARTSRVAFGRASVQEVDLGGTADEGTYATRPDAGWMRVSVVNASTGATAAAVANVTLGSVVYRNGETTLAYQAGGVWRSDGGSASMVSRPEFHFRNDTLTVPILATRGDGAVDGSVQVTSAGSPERRFPNRSANLTNRVEDAKVAVTVNSDYYLAWARYFREQTGGYVSVDHARETATVVFLALPETMHLREGIIATAGTGTLELHGTGDSGGYVDSYDSRNGDYAATQGANATVEAVNDVGMWGNSTIWGDLRSGGTVSFSGDPEVYGVVQWTDPPEPDAGDVDGEDGIERIDGVATVEPIDGFVEQRVAAIRADNDNADAEEVDLSDDELRLDKGTSASLGSGRYYLERVALNGGDLTLNTTEGDIVLAVRDCVLVNNQSNRVANLNVEGDGNVTAFVAGENDCTVNAQGERHVNLHVGKRANVDVPEEDSRQFRVYGTRSFNATIVGSQGHQTAFDGVVYAPAGLDGDGYLFIQHADLYGGVVAGSVLVDQDGAVHYDEALEEVPLPRSPTVSRLEYMHVSVHRVNVTDA